MIAKGSLQINFGLGTRYITTSSLIKTQNTSLSYCQPILLTIELCCNPYSISLGWPQPPAEKVESKSLIRHGFLIFLYPDNSTAERACDTGVRQQMILRINLVLREQ
jgi:hypothetical protein